jgi:class 3 adenylate cyclase
MNETLQDWAGKSEILALVFTDIVDSTNLWRELGDKQCIELIRRHIMRGRFLVSWHKGFEIKLIGDAFMVAFRNTVDALNFALDFQENTGDEQIKIRAGIHVGRIRIIENDLFGMMVNYTKRVESEAEPGGITLSNEAKTHIDAEKDPRHSKLFFVDFSKTLKGFDTPQKLWHAYTEPMMAMLARFDRYLSKSTVSSHTKASQKRKK